MVVKNLLFGFLDLLTVAPGGRVGVALTCGSGVGYSACDCDDMIDQKQIQKKNRMKSSLRTTFHKALWHTPLERRREEDLVRI